MSAQTESESGDSEPEAAALTDTEAAEDPVEFAEEALDAETMAGRIAAKGSVALYSIFFDVNSAAIRSESAATLEQVARLLAENPDLNLIVVGHTDNVGRLHYNLQLSERRAAAMVKQLINRYRVPKQRLRSAGVGFLAPVASNDSEEGRAKNRRVELVAD
jgi:outer membrane protein OmpA-like peptidoglycan-associated protein